jgi:hypothetical protein
MDMYQSPRLENTTIKGRKNSNEFLIRQGHHIPSKGSKGYSEFGPHLISEVNGRKVGGTGGNEYDIFQAGSKERQSRKIPRSIRSDSGKVLDMNVSTREGMLARRGSGASSKAQTPAAKGKGNVLTQGKISRFEEPAGASVMEKGSGLNGKGIPFMNSGMFCSVPNMNHALDHSYTKIARRAPGGEFAMAGNLKIDTNPSKMGQKNDGPRMVVKRDKSMGFPGAKK